MLGSKTENSHSAKKLTTTRSDFWDSATMRNSCRGSFKNAPLHFDNRSIRILAKNQNTNFACDFLNMPEHVFQRTRISHCDWISCAPQKILKIPIEYYKIRISIKKLVSERQFRFINLIIFSRRLILNINRR